MAVNCFIAGYTAGESSDWRSNLRGNILVTLMLLVLGGPLYLLGGLIDFGKWLLTLSQIRSYWLALVTQKRKPWNDEEYMKRYKNHGYVLHKIHAGEARLSTLHLDWIWRKFVRRDGIYVFGQFATGDLDYKNRAYLIVDLSDELFHRFKSSDGRVIYKQVEIVYKKVLYQGIDFDVTVHTNEKRVYLVFAKLLRLEGVDGLNKEVV